MSIQWYPGHMTKSFRMMEECVKLVDIVIELLDARIARSSKNPDIDRLAAGKRRLIILNKADLAEEAVTELWKNFYLLNGFTVMTADSVHGAGMEKIAALCENLMAEKKNAAKKRGRLFVPTRAMIAGIPNVGKSTLINKFAGGAFTKTSDKPGVTRGRQWIRVRKGTELLDTPGVLWPKFSDPEEGVRLALTGAIRDEILDSITLSLRLIEILSVSYPNAIPERYHIQKTEPGDAAEVLRQIGQARGFLLKGGVIDEQRSALILLDEFRGGKLGRISLERPS
jgi:ribosome biogenesis GTPase A